MRGRGSNLIASRSQVGDTKFPKIVSGSTAKVMGLPSRSNRASPHRRNANITHRITVQVYDLPSDDGGRLHVQDQVVWGAARLHRDRDAAVAGTGLHKSGALDDDEVLSRLNVLDRELTIRIGKSRVLRDGASFLSTQLHVCLSYRLPVQLL